MENGFSDGTLDAAQDTSATTKHTVKIDTSPNYKIGTDTMYDVTNNHDGTLTVGEKPEIIGSLGQLSKGYSIKYRSEKDNLDYALSGFKNPEFGDGRSWYTLVGLNSIPEQRKISITNIYTLFCVVYTYSSGAELLANYQRVENPIKVNYDPQGGSGEPKADWVWNGDGQWNTDHNIEPTKAGYKFAGWYTQANGNGSKIEGVSQAVNAAVAGSNNYKEITLYAKWEHKHVWQYSESGDTLKAYCSNTNSKCEYYGTGSDNAKATVSLKLNGFDNNKCAEYDRNYSVTCDNNNFTSETGATIGTIQYVGRDETEYSENSVPPTSPGKYKAKVNITLIEDQSSKEISTDFEIIKANATNFDSKVNITGWTYGENSDTPSIDPDLNPENQTVQYTYYTDGACTTQTSIENGAETEGGVPKNAGTYYVKAQIPESANYNA